MEIIPVGDAHCDFLYYMVNRGYSFGASPLSTQAVSLQGMREGNAALQLFAAWIDPDSRIEPIQQCLTLIDAYKRLLASCDALTPFDAGFTPSSGKIAAILTVEGGEAVQGRPENVRILYELGVRAMTLTWNATNELASPAMTRKDKGLTAAGREIVHEMERVGMAVDVAHLGDLGIDGVLSETEKPIFSSHTNARAVFDHRRSLSDRHIKEIASRGGVIGVNYYSPQLVRTGRAELTDVVRHIAHIAEVGGVKCVVLGSDFDGMGPQSYPVGLSSWADMQSLIAEMRKAGFGEDDIKLIAYENLAGYFIRFAAQS